MVAVGVTAAVAMVAVIFLGIHFGTSTVSGATAELIAGIASLIAVVIVTWMVLWMRTAAEAFPADYGPTSPTHSPSVHSR
jgi:high-affinity iron transporter